MLNDFRNVDVIWDKATKNFVEKIRVASSDERGRKLTVQVVNGGQVENLTGSTLSLYWITENKEHQGLDEFTQVDATQGIFEIYYTTEMLGNIGKLRANLHLTDEIGTVSSEQFFIEVFLGIDSKAVQSSDSFSTLNQALIEVQNIKQDEAERVSAETERITAEEERVSNENERKTAETTRNTNETTRVSNETDRVNAEDTRNANEMNRVDAETARVTAETARVTAEEEREQGYPALDGRITAVEQNIDLLTDKVQGFSFSLQFTNGAAVIPMSELGNEAPDKYVWQASVVRSVSAGTLAISIEPTSVALNIYLRTMDNTAPANAAYAVHLLRYG